MKPTLLVFAAGMGSRYGSLKQMDGIGPNGETIIDYSIYDAVRAGFGKIVYIVREYFHDAMAQSVKDFRFQRGERNLGERLTLYWSLEMLFTSHLLRSTEMTFMEGRPSALRRSGVGLTKTPREYTRCWDLHSTTR